MYPSRRALDTHLMHRSLTGEIKYSEGISYQHELNHQVTNEWECERSAFRLRCLMYVRLGSRKLLTFSLFIANVVQVKVKQEIDYGSSFFSKTLNKFVGKLKISPQGCFWFFNCIDLRPLRSNRAENEKNEEQWSYK